MGRSALAGDKGGGRPWGVGGGRGQVGGGRGQVGGGRGHSRYFVTVHPCLTKLWPLGAGVGNGTQLFGGRERRRRSMAIVIACARCFLFLMPITVSDFHGQGESTTFDGTITTGDVLTSSAAG